MVEDSGNRLASLKPLIRPEIVAMIASKNCTISSENDLRNLDIRRWLQAIMIGANGLFSSVTPNHVFVLDACDEESINYVTTHEFMHHISWALSNGIHGLVKQERHAEIYINQHTLLVEEEYRADSAAIKIMTSLAEKIPLWVMANRMSQYAEHLSSERMLELDQEVIVMLQSVEFESETKMK